MKTMPSLAAVGELAVLGEEAVAGVNRVGSRFLGDFEDAIDFVGWYTDLSNNAAGISKWDPYNQYLAYHEGQAGWQRQTYEQKGWLKKTAKRVDLRARKWWGQLQSCEADLQSRWWIFGG